MSHRPRRPLSEEERFRLRIQEQVRALAEPCGIDALAKEARFGTIDGRRCDDRDAGPAPEGSDARCSDDAGARCATALGPELVRWDRDGAGYPPSDALIDEELKRRARLGRWFVPARIDPALVARRSILRDGVISPPVDERPADESVPRAPETQAGLDWLDAMHHPPELPSDPLAPVRVDGFGNPLPLPPIDDRNLLWPGLWRDRTYPVPEHEPEPPPDPSPPDPSPPEDEPPAPRSQRAMTLVQRGELDEALRLLADGVLTPGELLLRSDIEAELGRRADAHHSAVRAVAVEVAIPGGTERVDRPVYDAGPPLPAFVEVKAQDTTQRVWFGAHVVLGRGGDFGIAAPVVSREHLGVSLDDGSIVLRDLRSTHGTEIEIEGAGRRALSRHLLEDRAVLWLGKEVRVVMRRIDAVTAALELPAETITLALGCTFHVGSIALSYAGGRYHFRSPRPLHQHGDAAREGVLVPPYVLRATAGGPVVLSVEPVRAPG